MTSAMFDLPVVDQDSAPWWAGTARHELLLQRCDECAVSRWPARAICGRCGSLTWSWYTASGHATVASWVVNRHRFSPTAPAVFTVVLARLSEQQDILIPAQWGGSADGTDLAMGLSVVVSFVDVDRKPDEPPLALLRWDRAAT